MAKKASLSEGQGEAVPPEVADDTSIEREKRSISGGGEGNHRRRRLGGRRPRKTEGVAEEAIRVEREDQEDQEESGR